MNDKVYTTGWWGIPGDLNGTHSTKVHLEFDGKPACGCHLRESMKYQQCAPSMWWSYLECERCKTIYRKKMRDLNEDLRIINEY